MSDRACEGAETDTVSLGCVDFERCRACGMRVRRDFVDHPSVGFAADCPEMGPARCRRCGEAPGGVGIVLVNGRWLGCNPFRACPACDGGTLESRPRPDWMNRFVCDPCGHKASR